ncbi:MAG TPA: cupredoxin family copper-binding protein [Steroidobacteraceae bacterium]
MPDPAVALRRRLLLTAAGALIVTTLSRAGMAANDTAAPKAVTVHTVTIEAMQYQPQALTVRPGDRIRWINKDLFPHTVTADGGGFDSPEIAPQSSWTFTARKAGEFPYGCRLHPTMKATLTVR